MYICKGQTIINIYMVTTYKFFFKKFMFISNENIKVKLTLSPLPPKNKQNWMLYIWEYIISSVGFIFLMHKYKIISVNHKFNPTCHPQLFRI